MKRRTLTLVILSQLLVISVFAQKVDSTILGTEYPWKLPLLGKKAWERGYRLPAPHGLGIGTIFNRQNIVLDNFEMAISEPDGSFGEYIDLDGILEFGPSQGRINTINGRFDTWILPFFGVGAYAGKVWGEQTISFSVVGSDFFESVTDINGNYYGFNLIGVVPLGFINLSGDYSWSWTTNDRLDKPVQVNVAGIRAIKTFPLKRPDQFFGVWVGTQYQRLEGQTSGSIGIDEGLGITDEDKAAIDARWQSFVNNEIPDRNGNYWDDLTVLQRRVYQGAYDWLFGLVESDIAYRFTKALEANWNLLLGGTYQHSSHWALRTEYGFVQSKQQLMFILEYRFGI